jgi:uncharacterized protein YndB with AHSA1/START domain
MLSGMEPTTITREIDLDTSVDVLWQAVSDPEQMSAWLGDSVDVDVRPGGTGTVVDDGIVRQVVVDEVSGPRHLAFRWWEQGDESTASRVVFSVGTNADGGSRLTITETLPDQSSRIVARALAGTRRWEVRAMSLWACTMAIALVR